MVEHLILCGLLSFICLPQFKIVGMGIYIGTLISPLALYLFLFQTTNSKLNTCSKLIALLCLVIVVCNCLGYYSFDYGYNYRDFIELIKYLQFIPYLLLISCVSPISLIILSKKYFKYSALIIATIGFIQKLRIPVLSNFVVSLYADPNISHGKVALQEGGRIILTGSDPNVAGFICLFFMFYFFCLSSVAVTPLKNKILGMCWLILCLFTQSRTVLISMIFSFISYILFISKIKTLYKIISIIFIIVSLVSIIVIFNLQYIILGFQNFANGANNSFNVRIQNILDSIVIFKKSPLFGLGVCKNYLRTTMDCEYASIIQRFGLSGLFAFGFLLSQFLLQGKNSINNAFGKTLVLLSFAALVIMCTNNIFSGYQLMSIFILLYILSKKSNHLPMEYQR